MWSIIQRELREQARQPATYWLRLIGAVLLLVLFWLVWNSNLARAINNGRGYFVGLNRILSFTIWLIGPVLTADCLSREKREGTLGLLFLTPLRALDVVLGKGFVNALKAFAMLLAALPILIIPVLLGGVSWPDAIRMFLLHGAALGLALTAGMVASSFTSTWIRARLLSFVLAVGAGVLFLLLHVTMTAFMVWVSSTGPARMDFGQMIANNFQTLWFRYSIILRNPAYFWRDFGLVTGGWASVRFALGVFGVSLLLVLAAIGVATRAVKRTWQAEPPSPAWQRRIRFFTDVRVSRGWFRERMRRLMDFNPVWWRHTSTWSARVTTLGWLGLSMILQTAAFTGFGIGAVRANWVLEKLLLFGVAFSAASSFRRERETGAMELLLVTGLEPARMLQGRLLALAVQFGPAALLVWGIPVMLAWADRSSVYLPPLWSLAWMAPTALLGLALSLSRVSFLVSCLIAASAHHVVATAKMLFASLFLKVEDVSLGNLALSPQSATEFFLQDYRWIFGLFELAVMLLLARSAWRYSVRSLAQRTFLVASPRVPAAEPSPVPRKAEVPR